jgi:hypothetical protein
MAIFRAILTLRLEKNNKYSELTFKEQKQLIKLCLRLNNNNEESDKEFGYLINELLSVNSRDREQLKSVRRGEWKQEDIIRWFENKETSLEKVYLESKLQHGPDEEQRYCWKHRSLR